MEEVVRIKRKKKEEKTSRKVLTIVGDVFAVIGTTIGMLLVGIYAIMLICTHGPSKIARDLFVLSVRETSAVGFLANMVCSKSQIAAIEAANKVIDIGGVSDSTLIQFTDKDGKDEPPSDLEDEGLKPYHEKDGIMFYEVSGSTYAGTMVVVPDPSRVFVGTSGDYKGEPGINVPGICDKYNATAAINAGGFEDIGGVGDGGTPLGIVMSEGNLKYGNLDETYNVIGFDKNNVGGVQTFGNL